MLLERCREPGINSEPAVSNGVKVDTFADFRPTIDISTLLLQYFNGVYLSTACSTRHCVCWCFESQFILSTGEYANASVVYNVNTYDT